MTARATISLLPPDSSNGVLLQHISSGGLWGIELEPAPNQDAASAYMEQVEREELDELAAQLHAIGFSRRAVKAAFRNVTRKGE